MQALSFGPCTQLCREIPVSCAAHLCALPNQTHLSPPPSGRGRGSDRGRIVLNRDNHCANISRSTRSLVHAGVGTCRVSDLSDIQEKAAYL
jgi:hypothetical protein